MNSALNQLILLGFLCQGLTWDDYLLPSANAALWFLCSKLLRGRLRLSATVEAVLLALGSAVSYWMCEAFGKSSHFFIGHGITLVLASRLLREMNRREQVITLAMAGLQLGVGCTFLFDLRFAPILAGAVIVLPRALMELEAAAFAPPAEGRRLTPRPAEYFVLMGIMAAVFLTMPRGNWGAPMRSFRSEKAGGGTTLDSELDLLRSPRPLPREVFLQIQGENLGRLRCYSLIYFNGRQWREGSAQLRRPLETASESRLRGSLVRKAHLKSVAVLRRVLPADGAMLKLEGAFFNNPLIDYNGGVECEGMWSSANNSYTYWIDARHSLPAPSAAYQQWLTFHPPQSEKLIQWLDGLVRDIPDAHGQASRLEAYLRDNYAYSLEAPKLDPSNPVEDFLFQQRKGHCERFAGTLALLLRMRGIPSRVILGYVPVSRAWFSDGYVIRHSDAHAWTEAWFDSVGWVTLDATPGSGGGSPLGRLRDFWTSLDLLWTLNVVGFDSNTQFFALSWATNAIEYTGEWLERHWRQGVVMGVGAAALFACIGLRGRLRRFRRPFFKRACDPEAAAHFYDEMIRGLARRGFVRKPHQTPIEFAEALSAAGLPHEEDVDIVTQAFCDFRYGSKSLDSPRQAAVRQSLGRILAARKPASAPSSRGH